MTQLVSIPFQMSISPMTSYNTANDDYSLMNYVLAGVSATTIALPIATWLTKSPVRRNSVEPSIENDEPAEKSNNSATDL